jgi:carbonic anhydrase
MFTKLFVSSAVLALTKAASWTYKKNGADWADDANIADN